jgi:hypothetical protein
MGLFGAIIEVLCSFGWFMGFLNWVFLSMGHWCMGSYLIRFSVLLMLCVFFL